MVSKDDVRRAVKDALSKYGFKASGNYYRRTVDNAHQALHLQPAYYGGVYFPEMLISYSDLNSGRRNTQMDCHLSSRLSSYFHPDGDPRDVSLQHWLLSYDNEDVNRTTLQEQICIAVPVFLTWLSWYPTWQVAADKMRLREHATWVRREYLFQDLGQSVPMPA